MRKTKTFHEMFANKAQFPTSESFPKRTKSYLPDKLVGQAIVFFVFLL